jgi:hypothetical protein
MPPLLRLWLDQMRMDSMSRSRIGALKSPERRLSSRCLCRGPTATTGRSLISGSMSLCLRWQVLMLIGSCIGAAGRSKRTAAGYLFHHATFVFFSGASEISPLTSPGLMYVRWRPDAFRTSSWAVVPFMTERRSSRYAMPSPRSNGRMMSCGSTRPFAGPSLPSAMMRCSSIGKRSTPMVNCRYVDSIPCIKSSERSSIGLHKKSPVRSLCWVACM